MNPVNAHIVDGTILAVTGNQVWFRAGEAPVETIRGWLPPGMRSDLTLDSEATIYLDATNSINGWWARGDHVGVNQRHYEGGVSDEVATLTCQDECGRPWVAPAPEGLLKASEHCLTCNGDLAVTD